MDYLYQLQPGCPHGSMWQPLAPFAALLALVTAAGLRLGKLSGEGERHEQNCLTHIRKGIFRGQYII